MAQWGTAWFGVAWRGVVRQGMAGRGSARHGVKAGDGVFLTGAVSLFVNPSNCIFTESAVSAKSRPITTFATIISPQNLGIALTLSTLGLAPRFSYDDLHIRNAFRI
jgi:hypothetical protein